VTRLLALALAIAACSSIAPTLEQNTAPAPWRTAVTPPPSDSAPPGHGDLQYEGTVTAIDNAPLPQSRLNWVVRTRVDRVLSGTFTGVTFDFRVHSPALSGLEVGRRYVIRAKAVPDGYVVDEHQWRA
jgi:hypothetical protein